MCQKRGSITSVLWFALGTWPGFCQPLGSLRTVRIPEPSGVEKYVRDRDALIVLGKALFWDMQVGSDGRTACASCHFHAGADHCKQNQLSNPNGPFPVNRTLVMEDFPFRTFEDPANNRSAILRESRQRAGSAGVFRRVFSSLAEGAGAEDGSDLGDAPGFRIDALNVRQVTTRNTPTVINSVFTIRNLWDGRASDIFTGATPFGDSDPRANVIAVFNGQLVAEKVRIGNSSLASQAVGPPMNPVEMSYDGRTWPMLGKKMLPARPLANQEVAPDDSVLGPYAGPEGRGLRYAYLSLIQAAFQPEYWDSTQLVGASGLSASEAGEFTIAEFNFACSSGLLSRHTRPRW